MHIKIMTIKKKNNNFLKIKYKSLFINKPIAFKNTIKIFLLFIFGIFFIKLLILNFFNLFFELIFIY